jgi:hypothetical protein
MFRLCDKFNLLWHEAKIRRLTVDGKPQEAKFIDLRHLAEFANALPQASLILRR